MARRSMLRDRPKVLEISKGLGRGGTETLLARRLAVASTFHNFDYVVVNTRASIDALEGELSTAGVRVRPIGPTASELYRVIREEAPDVINVHAPTPALHAKAWTTLRRTTRRDHPVLIETVHSVRYRTISTWASSASSWIPDHVIPVSPSIGRSRLCRLARRKSVTIQGIDTTAIGRWQEVTGHEFRKSLGISETEVVLAMVAGFRREKGHDRLLDALRYLPESLPLRILLVGDGVTRAHVERRAQAEGLTPRVLRFLGTQPDAWRHIAIADATLLTSDYEGLPVVVMESLAASRPVLSTRVGGVPDLICDGGNGLLCGVRPRSVAQMLMAYVSSRELQLQLAHGAKLSASELDIVRVAERMERIYWSHLG